MTKDNRARKRSKMFGKTLKGLKFPFSILDVYLDVTLHYPITEYTFPGTNAPQKNRLITSYFIFKCISNCSLPGDKLHIFACRLTCVMQEETLDNSSS